MRITCLFLCTALLTHRFAVGADKFTPYEAVVDVDDGESVWGGPDTKKHYPTSRLEKGERVKVIRHDPGGWCVIEPPAGSFSWIRSEYVRKDGPSHGSVIENGVKVHVGSELKPDRFLTYQAELSKGSAVEILGEQVFQFDDTPRLMLKIKPVNKREFRFIKRRSIVAVDSMKSDPFQNERTNPKRKNGPVADSDAEANAWPVSVGSIVDEDQEEASTPTPAKTRDQNLPPGKQRLTDIDREFHEMIKNEPPTWNLDSLEDAYKQLDEDIGTPSMTAQIARRLETVKRYRKTYNEYNDFMKLTSETKQRDAMLLAQQTQLQSQLGTPQRAMPINPDSTSPSNQPTPNNPQQKLVPTPDPSSSAGPSKLPAGTPPQAGTTPSFDGAGIVRKLAKSFPGGPQFILVGPDEKFLTFLIPGQGVDLNRYNGRPVGITGPRQRREDWNADILTVQTLQPVQLRGSK